MLVVTVHAAIGNQPNEMKPACPRLAECFLQNFISRQLALRDRFVNPSQILINDPTGAEIEMANLGIPHLSLRQTDVTATRAQGRAWIFAIKPIVKWRL